MTDHERSSDREPEESSVRIDDSIDVSLTSSDRISKFDLDTLNDLGIIETTTETKNGDPVVTELALNLDYLALSTTEFNTSERSLGNRFERTRWRAESRLRL